MTDARTWLDQVDARTNAATDGPWAAYDANEGDDPAYSPLWSVANDALATPPDDDNEPWLAVEVQVLTGVRDDAEFIAAARTDLPAATVALRAVLDLADEADQVARQAADNNPEWADAHSTMAACIRAAITTALTQEDA